MALINTTTTGVLGTTVYGDGAGALTVQKDGVTQGVYGNIPAFSAYTGAAQTISNSTLTKIQFNSKLFDTNNNFDTTNYRYLPTVAGYYQINFMVENILTASRAYYLSARLYKNGTQISTSQASYTTSGGATDTRVGSTLAYMNGTTDYLELYTYHYDYTATSTIVIGNANNSTVCLFQGFLVKAV